MNKIQRTALLAFFLLILMAFVGWWFGGEKSKATEAEPDVVTLDVSQTETVMLLPPQSRKKFISGDRFRAEPVDDPYNPSGRRASGGEVAVLDTPANDPARGGASSSRNGNGGASNASLKDLRSVRLRQNETLSQVALRELGDKNRWRELLVLNNLKDERSVQVGELLYLPDPGTFVPINQKQPNNASLKPARGARSHTVQRGDVLGTISQKYYGTSKETKRILVANDLKNANQIYAGQVLVIPPRD
ncbi:MAG: LysM peptidoglycan-binding domain-containing protein [Planctomycetes bacterium]|nr:LysM peptidoglycan-binding domain-containing protein [Planctomycetota bacterium]MCP4772148.1 LysM peptidoglycan-binding domain-containing protein [Planctomycetota bacterium]MCP4861391.1 LysM peptidoglycan-binding domain-containing protein [Planctomycetota bacterium]